MNLQGKINVIKDAKDDIRAAIIAKGVTPSGNISTYATAIDEIDTTNNTNVTVAPSTITQTLTPSESYSGYGTVTVTPVTASIDSNIVASNIKSGVNILGVNGSVVELKGETKTVSITSTSGNTFTPSSGKNGITLIKVNPNNQVLRVAPSTIAQTFTVPNGYSGYETVTAPPVTASIDSNIKAENIKSGVNILGVNGTITELKGETKTISPSTSQQTITPSSGKNGITQLTVNAVTKSIDANITAENIKKDVNILGVTGTLMEGIARQVVNGTYKAPTYSFTWSLPSDATDLDINILRSAFYHCTGLTSVDLSSLTIVSGANAMQGAFKICTNLINVDLSNLTTLSSSYSMESVFEGCTSLTSVDLSSLTTVSGSYAMSSAFSGCTGLTSVDLSNLTTVNSNGVLNRAFEGCTSLKTLSFPKLKNLGSWKTQFDTMLYNVTGCTVHFPSNLQSVIGSWSSVTGGFDGTNTTVLFDLPATS